MRFLITASILAALPLSVTAQEFDADIDFAGLNRSQFVDEMQKLAEATWAPMMQLYMRVGPDIAELTPSFELSEAHLTAYACMFDQLSDADALDEVNTTRDSMIEFALHLDANPEYDFVAFVQDETRLDLLVPDDNYLDASIDCGVIALNQNILIESGMMGVLQEKMMQDN